MQIDSSQKRQKRENGFVKALKNSLIISSIDRFCVKIYKLLVTGFFAGIFGRYSSGTTLGDRGKEKRSARKKRFAEKLENSFIVNILKRVAFSVIHCRLKVMGVFLITFGVYTSLQTAVKYILADIYYDKYMLIAPFVEALVCIVISVFFLSSKKTLLTAASSSRLITGVLKFFDFTTERDDRDVQTGSSLFALIFGVVCGAATYLVDPLYIIGGLVALGAVYAVMCKPEIGVIALFFLMPLIPTFALLAVVIVTAVSFGVKIILSKRVFRVDRVDIFIMTFAALMFLGGFVSLSTDSIEPALMYAVFIFAAVPVSCCIRSREWLMKCAGAFIVSALLIALYGIFMYIFGKSMTAAWIDKDMFGDIENRAISTLENPNMLGEYLTMAIPVTIAFLISGEKMSRKTTLVSALCMGVCLILTWSRGAWLGLILSAILFVFMWSRRSVWFIFGGVLSLPVLATVLPSTIVSRFTSIGNTADHSTTYRVSIWKSGIKMFRDNFFGGIGVGQGAWDEIFDRYAEDGVTVASHAHNLYIQLGLEIGIIGLIVFFAVLLLTFKSGFGLFGELSGLPDSPDRDGVNAKKIKMSVIGPLCGIFAVLVQGLTDYSWYNYRVTLMFWLLFGLAMGLSKCGRDYVSKRAPVTEVLGSSDGASCDVPISQ